MTQSLTIGNTTFPNNLIQGPLAGYSCAPFRYLTWEYSQPAYTCTEMISAKSLIYQPKKSFERYTKLLPNEGPVCFQLSGNDAKELGEASKIVTDLGASLIDLNCGCPVKKIRSKGAGSGLLNNTGKMYEVITAIKQHTHLPVSVKIRVQGDSEDKFNQDVARVITEAGADCLIVHGRHWTEKYDVSCRYDQIAFFVNEMKIPVIGNGDISCVASLKTMLATGCAGVMIARAGVGQPWLIAQLRSEMTGQPYSVPQVAEIGALFERHLDLLDHFYADEKLTILQARKLIKYYARSVESRAELVDAVNRCEQRNQILQLTRRYFTPHSCESRNPS